MQLSITTYNIEPASEFRCKNEQITIFLAFLLIQTADLI